MTAENDDILLGYDDVEDFVEAPDREEEMKTSLCRRKDGTYFLHRILCPVDEADHDCGDPVGNVQMNVTPEQAAAWWVEHFFPIELRPFIRSVRP